MPTVPDLAALGDDLPGAGLELALDRVDPLVRRDDHGLVLAADLAEHPELLAEACARWRACRSSSMAMVPSETSMHSMPHSSTSAQVLVELALAQAHLEERAAEAHGDAAALVERDLLLEVRRDDRGAPAELDDVDVVAGDLEELATWSRPSPLSSTCVRPLSRGLCCARGASGTRTSVVLRGRAPLPAALGRWYQTRRSPSAAAAGPG